MQEKRSNGVKAAEDEMRVDGFDYSETFNNKLKAYNANIKNLDPLYANLKPFSSKILVRVVVDTLKQTEDGIYIPYQTIVRVRTQNGMGNFEMIESPYPYSRRAVVVAVPPGFETVKPGDEIVLASKHIEARVEGQGKDYSIVIPGAFIHPDFAGFVLPRDPEDRHYGYLLVDFYSHVEIGL